MNYVLTKNDPLKNIISSSHLDNLDFTKKNNNHIKNYSYNFEYYRIWKFRYMKCIFPYLEVLINKVFLKTN